MNQWDTIYFNPSNIFFARDFYLLKNHHGQIKIGVEGGRGWKCWNADSGEMLIDGLDVWAMCRWLNEHATEYKRN